MGRNLEAGAAEMPWRGAADCLGPHGLLSLLPYRTKNHHSGVAPPKMAWVFSHQSLACLQTDLLKTFSQLRFPLR